MRDSEFRAGIDADAIITGGDDTPERTHAPGLDTRRFPFIDDQMR